MMTVRELISALEDYDEDAEVRIAIQPRWPLEYSVGDVVCTDSIGEAEEADETDEGGPVVVYLVEGTQVGYAPPGVFGGGRS